MEDLKFFKEEIRDCRNGEMFTRHHLKLDDKQTGFSFDSDSSDDSAYVEKKSNETIKSYKDGQYYANNRKEWLRKYRNNPSYYNSLVKAEQKLATVVEDYGMGDSGNYLLSLEEGEKRMKTFYSFKENVSKEDKEIIKEAISFGIFNRNL
jgi:hypothetical protein